VPENPLVDVRMTAGRLMVRADSAATDATVESVRAKLASDSRAVAAAAAVAVASVDGRLLVELPEPPGRGRTPQVLVEVRVPEGASVAAEAFEADVVCTGRVGALYARTTAGSVHAEQVSGRLDVRSGRGPVTVHLCEGPADVAVADAGVIIRACAGPLRINGRSGDVHVWWLAASATLSTSTGNLRIGWARGRRVNLDVQTGTGRLDLGVANDPNATDVLTVRTISGDVRLTPADR
jgi:hypothetical protein